MNRLHRRAVRRLPSRCLLRALCLCVSLAGLSVGGLRAELLPPRPRKAFSQLDAKNQAFATACQDAARKVDGSTGSAHTRAELDLLDQAKKLTASAPDFFLGWVWLARASLDVNEEPTGRSAGRNLIALGVAQNRNLQVLRTMADLEKKGWLDAPGAGMPPATTVANRGGAASGLPAWAKPSSPLPPEDRLEFETVLKLVTDLDNATTDDQTAALGEQFMAHSKTFLGRYPNDFAVWLLRAHVCLTYEMETEGREAALNLKRLGGFDKSDPYIHEQMVAYNAKGWFQKPSRYEGKIGKPGGKGDMTPCAVELDADRLGGKITYGSAVGDTTVRFSGTLADGALKAKTGDVVTKPERVKWDGETFLLKFSANDTQVDYECVIPASGYVGELLSK